jgi:hypothetical protein
MGKEIIEQEKRQEEAERSKERKEYRKIIKITIKKLKLDSVAVVRKGNIATERPPLVGEVSVNFCG